jgi:hypothetical protein
MDIWTLFSYGAWVVSIALFIWMVVDSTSVSKEFSEDFLMSSREGEE